MQQVVAAGNLHHWPHTPRWIPEKATGKGERTIKILLFVQ
jgi:hypothetical protein